MSKCIVSFSSMGRENYNQAQLRLIKSIKWSGWDGGVVMQSYDGYVDEYKGVKIELGSYPKSEKYNLQNNNSEIPYGFKPEIVQVAIERGYEQVIWCDSTILLAKEPVGYLKHAKQYGVAAVDNIGHPLQYWISDKAVEKLGITEDELKNVPQIMACVIAFDFTNPIGVEIFTKWIEASRDGVSFQNYDSTRDGFRAHRHDQAVLSGLLWMHNVPLLPYGRLVYHPHDETGEYGNDFDFINKGI